MAAVGVGGMLPGCSLAGNGITAAALLSCIFICTQKLAEGSDLLRVGGELAEGLIKYGDPDLCDRKKVFQK